MDTLIAFARGEAARAAGAKKVFDWNKVAEYIRDNKPVCVVSGLASDMEWTSGCIWKDGKPVCEYTYLSSCWATPIFDADCHSQACFTDESSGWDNATSWPESALAILGLTQADVIGDS